MKYRLILTFCFSLFLFSCKNVTDKKYAEIVDSTVNNTKVVDAHNSQNSLDWSGTYSGVIPCADCEGVETEIILKKDLTFIKRTKYLGIGDQKMAEELGSFVWDKTRSFVILKGINEVASQYKVGENSLTQLDMDGKVISGPLASNYILRK